MKPTLQESLEWGSSEVDWCESNYDISVNVAEFFNTISNVLFLVFPPVLIYLSRQYAQQVSWGINVVWGMLAVVGLGSVYFHCTLSLVGQLVDEIAIIWLFIIASALWFPRRFMPSFCQEDRQMFMTFALVMGVISTGLACMMPAINCMVLMVICIPALGVLHSELTRCKSHRVYLLGIRTTVIAVVALFSWLSDKVFCSIWKSIGFPYMHCFWHIFVALAAYQACVLYAYFNAMAEAPDQMPRLSYWPRDSWGTLGIPYVQLRKSDAKGDCKSF